MKKKPRFNPEITRVKLNPEQAVLFCQCYSEGLYVTTGRVEATVCDGTSRAAPIASTSRGGAAAS